MTKFLSLLRLIFLNHRFSMFQPFCSDKQHYLCKHGYRKVPLSSREWGALFQLCRCLVQVDWLSDWLNLDLGNDVLVFFSAWRIQMTCGWQKNNRFTAQVRNVSFRKCTSKSNGLEHSHWYQSQSLLLWLCQCERKPAKSNQSHVTRVYNIVVQGLV